MLACALASGGQCCGAFLCPAGPLAHTAALVVGRRLSTKAPPLPGPVEKIRFICFDFWKAAFNKHADKLRTRQKARARRAGRSPRALHPPHRAPQVVFFLTDSDFPWLRAMSSTSERDASQYARHYVTMVLGFIRGALHTLGMPSRVDIESIQGSDCAYACRSRWMSSPSLWAGLRPASCGLFDCLTTAIPSRDRHVHHRAAIEPNAGRIGLGCTRRPRRSDRHSLTGRLAFIASLSMRRGYLEGAAPVHLRRRDYVALLAACSAVYFSLQVRRWRGPPCARRRQRDVDANLPNRRGPQTTGSFTLTPSFSFPLDPRTYANGHFPEVHERLPPPVVADVDSDGRPEVVVVTREPAIKILSVSAAAQHSHTGVFAPAEERSSATLLAYTRVARGRHPVALAAGYVDAYQPGTDRKQVRRSSGDPAFAPRM